MPLNGQGGPFKAERTHSGGQISQLVEMHDRWLMVVNGGRITIADQRRIELNRQPVKDGGGGVGLADDCHQLAHMCQRRATS